jgi:hypothetical protein
MHSQCAEKKRGWFDFREQVDPGRTAKADLPGLPPDATHSLIARYFRDQCPEFHNRARIYDAGRMRATFVGSRWDLADQSNVLLMAASQPVSDRLRWKMPEPSPGAKRDYRRGMESHQFRFATMQQIIPMLDKIRFEMLDANPYLIGLPGGMVGDLRTGQTRQMERLLGYCLLGALPHHIWPLWTGEGGNGKSCLARLLHYILGDFCALVRWSERPMINEALITRKRG